MAKVNFGWLKTYNNEYFAPKSILSQLYADNGTSLEKYLGETYSPRATEGDIKNPIYMDNGIPKACGDLLEVSITGNAETATDATNATNVNIAKGTTSPRLYILGATETGNTRIYQESSIYMENNIVNGATWNDYAEYRKQEQKLLPGFCVKSTDNGILNYTTKRLEPCEGVVSDTFGFAIGETDECKTPLAVAGRVLVYTDEDRENFHFGDAVCASANGRVSKMTREEIKEYPDRIIGIVSEIPDYETWGEGNIAVNNRIWIKVK